MFVEYTPEGGDTQTFEFIPGRLRASEAAAIETAYSKLVGTGKTIQEFINDVRQGSSAARRLLLHRLLRRQHPQIRFDDVDPYEDEIKVVFTKAEFRDVRDSVEKLRSISDAEKAEMLARLDDEIESAPDSGMPLAPGKAASTSTEETAPSET